LEPDAIEIPRLVPPWELVNMNEMGKTLFWILDFWASCFLSRTRTAFVLPEIAAMLTQRLSALKTSLADPALDELCAWSAPMARSEPLDLPHTHAFNLRFLEFFTAHESDLPDIGRQMLGNLRKTFPSQIPDGARDVTEGDASACGGG
jgi:hypothetical protein